MKLPIVDLQGKKKGDKELSPSVFGVEAREDILARVVLWQQAKARSGCHATKTVSQVSGTGKKPFRQKGTGSARQGTKRAVQHRGGAVSHGPVVRDHGYKLPKKVRQLGLKCALSSKMASGDLIVLESSDVKKPSAKTMRAALETLKCEGALIIDGSKVNENMVRSVSNLPKVDMLPQQGLNVLDILKHPKLVLTVDAVDHIHARLQG